MKVYIFTGEHPYIPGIPVAVFDSQAGAQAEAAKMVAIIRQDTLHSVPSLPEVNVNNWETVLEALADYYGAQHCWVDVSEHEIRQTQSAKDKAETTDA